MNATLAKPIHRSVDPFAGCACVEHDYPLARHTWYRIGGPARYFARPPGLGELQEIVTRAADAGISLYVLGLGANLLVADDGVDGLVVRLDADAWTKFERRGESVTVAAGHDLYKLVLRLGREGLAGLECMAGIPGTVGGGVRMNAGGKFGDLGSRVRFVTAMEADGTFATLDHDELHFEYRQSNIAAPIILSAELSLDEDDPAAVTARTNEIWQYKKASQPLNGKSAGCAFKNPPGDLSAGSLIDRSGCKGLRVGGAGVSERHANFIVADPGCRAADVTALIAEVQRRVEIDHGVRLETEVQIWPRMGDIDEND